jgi:hypothetical protein
MLGIPYIKGCSQKSLKEILSSGTILKILVKKSMQTGEKTLASKKSFDFKVFSMVGMISSKVSA